MPIFEAKNLPAHDEDSDVLALILHPTPAAREARERGRARIERTTMLAELAPAVPGTTLATFNARDIAPAV
ncbi:hypothetical protein ACFQWF_04535 [Methylorubrum suomiense]